MTNLINFDFKNQPIRAFADDPLNPLFVAIDVAEALGYSTPKQAIVDHCKGVAKRLPLQTAGGLQKVRVIDEPDMYRLIFGSKLQSAVVFQDWVFTEVLPAIRKTGSFSSSMTVPDFNNPAVAARAWADMYEAKLLSDKTKAEIGSRREATAMNTASVAVKMVNRLEVELDRSRFYATIKRMEMLYHGTKFDWRVLKQASIDIGVKPIAVFDQNYGTVKSYHAAVWLEAYALEVSPGIKHEIDDDLDVVYNNPQS